MALRHVCAEARAIYLAVAAERLGVAVGTLEVRDGTIVGPGNLRTSYWELADDALLARDASPNAWRPSRSQRGSWPDRASPRIDIPDKVFGRPRFIHDRGVRRPAARPRAAAAAPGAKLLDARCHGRGAHAGCCGRGARRQLRRRGRRDRAGGRRQPLRDCARPHVERGLRAARRGAACRLAAQPARRDHHRRQARGGQAGGRRPHAAPQLHAALPRPCLDGAVLRRRALGRAGARGVDAQRRASSTCAPTWRSCCRAPPESIVVEHMEGAGCYGQNGADDVGARCRAAGPRRAGPARAPAMVARGRDGLGAARRRHGHRHRGRPRRGGRDRRLAARRVEQRARLAAGPRPRRRRCSPPRSSPSRSSA